MRPYSRPPPLIPRRQSPQSGAANDLILQPDYALLPTLRSLLALDDCPRADPLFCAALRCLAALSRDFMRWTGGANSWFLELHVLEFVLSQVRPYLSRRPHRPLP